MVLQQSRAEITLGNWETLLRSLLLVEASLLHFGVQPQPLTVISLFSCGLFMKWRRQIFTNNTCLFSEGRQP